MKFVVGPSRNPIVQQAFALHDAATRAAKKAKPEPEAAPGQKPATKKAAKGKRNAR